MNFQVELTERAQRDIDEAFAWLVSRSPAAAAQWHEELLATIGRLEMVPERCRIAAQESAAYRREVRQLLCGVYRVLFTIEGRTVYVLAVRHGRRRYLTAEDLG